MQILADKVAIVTGAAGGIGRAIAERFATEGSKVLLADIDPKVEKTSEEINSKIDGTRCKASVVDVSSGVQVNQLIQYAVNEYGQIDIMVNNAGVNPIMAPVVEITDEVFDKIVGINLKGVFNGCRAAVKQMQNQGAGGNVINIASYYGKRGYAYFAVYCASKAAVINFTQALALEVAGEGIRVNCICPGNIMTGMHEQSLHEEAAMKNIPFNEVREFYRKNIPVQRHGTGEDIAGAAVALCTNNLSYVTGIALNVSGGLEMG